MTRYAEATSVQSERHTGFMPAMLPAPEDK